MNSELSNVRSHVLEVHSRISAACARSGRHAREVTLVAVSKGVGTPLIEAAYAAGTRHFGENRVQEAGDKIARLTDLAGITWHMVGHLQSNKAKVAANLFHIIHSVDSIRLADALSRHLSLWPEREALPILLQVNVAGESTKQGFSVADVSAACQSIYRLPGLSVRGLMTIAPLAANAEEARPVFRKLKQLGDSLGLVELSMGMTDDFEVAVEEGATMVRIGRAIFGQRA